MFPSGIGLSQVDPFFEFTQVEQSDRWHSCQATFRRLENTTDKYNEIVNSSDLFTDVNFPYNDGLFWVDAGQGSGDMAQAM